MLDPNGQKKPHTRTTHARAYIKLLCLCSLDSSKHMKMSVFIRSASKTANSKTRSATRTHAARRVSAYFSIEHKMSIEFRVLTSRVPWNFWIVMWWWLWCFFGFNLRRHLSLLENYSLVESFVCTAQTSTFRSSRSFAFFFCCCCYWLPLVDTVRVCVSSVAVSYACICVCARVCYQ